jgi:nucleotide-binding universal stress UspA family protein
MKKNIIIGTDNSLHCKASVRYAVDLAKRLDHLAVMLVHVEPMVSDYLVEAKNINAMRVLQKKNRAKALELLEAYKKEMLRRGMPENRIQLKTLSRKKGIAEDLLTFAQEGQFDAILTGRRGVSYLKNLMMGSVTANLLNHSQVVPIWVVDGEISSHHFLVAVDGSENALRTVDHLSFVLNGISDAKIVFFHVQPKLRDYCEINFDDQPVSDIEKIFLDTQQKCIDEFYGKAIALLDNAGFKKDQIQFKAVSNNLRVGKAILEEVQNGDYGTIIIGKHGTGKTVFSGSVSRYVVSKATDCAIWVIP